MESIGIGNSAILKFTFGKLATNCYLVQSNNEIALIDAPNSNEIENMTIYNAIKESGTLKYIINTHGHFDHIVGNAFLKEKFKDAKILIHKCDRGKLASPELNGSLCFWIPLTSPDRDVKIDANSHDISVGDIYLRFLYTPGHTKGSISIAGDGFVFTGDTLFQGTVGIAKEYTGAFDELINSVKTQLLTLPAHFIVLPGHGEKSTIEEEANFNPFLT